MRRMSYESVDKEMLKNFVYDTVLQKQGIKAVELFTDIAAFMAKQGFWFDIEEIVNEIETEGSIIHLDYVLPNMEYRLKSMYFPKGTIFYHESFSKTS